MSVIFQSYLKGIVAGKISEAPIAAGFKHASVLAVIGCKNYSKCSKGFSWRVLGLTKNLMKNSEARKCLTV
jgi:hypothetical protein